MGIKQKSGKIRFHRCVRIFLLCLFLKAQTPVVFGQEKHVEGGDGIEKDHPLADFFLPGYEGGAETLLKAEDVLSGEWKEDVKGECVPGKGCAYRNRQGKLGYLSSEEKTRLQALKPNIESPPAKNPPVVQNNKIQPVSTENDLETALSNSTDKDVVLVLFGASNCGPCHDLQANIRGRKDPNLAVFLAERPDYNFFSGNPLHVKHKNEIGPGVPAAFIYTKGKDGNWIKEVVRGPIISKLNLALQSAKKTRAQSQASPAGNSRQATQSSTPEKSKAINLEFSQKPGGGMTVRQPGSDQPQQVFLVKTGPNERKAAFKTEDGTYKVAPQFMQEGLKKYYQGQADKIQRLSTEAQDEIKLFLQSNPKN